VPDDQPAKRASTDADGGRYILFFETVSGTHYNPAAGLAPVLRGDFPWKGVPACLVTKFAGAAGTGR
jgi:glycerol uptake facilitator-like aquaporin